MIGTSETTRETSFNFKNYRNISGIGPDKISDHWLEWFIGFAEGDGAFMTGKDDRLRFVLTQKEIAILDHVHETLGIGRVRTYGPFSRYHIDDKNGILILTALLNGNLVLEKRKVQVKRWLDVLDIAEIESNLLPHSLLSSGWLSGLIDAEGCFNVSLFKRQAMALGYQVKLIDQKDSLDALLHIKEAWNMILTIRKLKDKVTISVHRVEINSFVKVPPIVKYLSEFRLKTKKHAS